MENTASTQWKYVSTKENPADILSRGLFPSVLENNDLSFHGPAWLRMRESSWKSNEEELSPNDPNLITELKSISINTMITVWTPTEHLLNYCSDYIQLLIYTAWYQRFFKFLKNKNQVKKGHLSTSELNAAKLRWMNPFLDENDLLRVGGRLSFSEISYDEKHPFILHKESHLSELIIKYHHECVLHAGAQLTLAEIRRKYWIIGANSKIHF